MSCYDVMLRCNVTHSTWRMISQRVRSCHVWHVTSVMQCIHTLCVYTHRSHHVRHVWHMTSQCVRSCHVWHIICVMQCPHPICVYIYRSCHVWHIMCVMRYLHTICVYTKFSVSFAEYSLFYRALLQTRSIIFNVCYAMSPLKWCHVMSPCHVCDALSCVWCNVMRVMQCHVCAAMSCVWCNVTWCPHIKCVMHCPFTCIGRQRFNRLLKIIGIFCRILSLWWGSFANKTCNFKEPTHRSQPTDRDIDVDRDGYQ